MSISALENFFIELANIERTVTSIAALPNPANHAPVYPPSTSPTGPLLPMFINTLSGSEPVEDGQSRLDRESKTYHFAILFLIAPDKQPAALAAIVPYLGQIEAAFGRGKRNQFNFSCTYGKLIKTSVGYYPYIDRLYTGAAFYLDVQIDQSTTQ